ncbi:site-specific DNA-methyltransferase [Isosphaeraceae bacterium EP7]
MTSPLAPRNRLMTADCIDGMAALGDGTVDLAFADPPFNIGYKYDIYDDRKKADQYLDWCRRWIGQVARVLKPDGTFWMAIGDEFAAELKVIAHREAGLVPRSWVIWYYTFGVNCKRKFSRSHAHLFHFVKDPARFTFEDESIRVPSARQLIYGDRRANPTGRLPDDTWILRPQDIPGKGGFKPVEDTWYIPRVCGTFKERAGFHGCQMPEQLLGRIIRVSSRPGDLVLDPFAGSGTTLVAAKKLGRDYLGFELSPDYAAQAQTRLDACEPGAPLQGGDEPQVDPTAAPTKRGRPVVARVSKSVVEPAKAAKPAMSSKAAAARTKIVKASNAEANAKTERTSKAAAKVTAAKTTKATAKSSKTTAKPTKAAATKAVKATTAKSRKAAIVGPASGV